MRQKILNYLSLNSIITILLIITVTVSCISNSPSSKDLNGSIKYIKGLAPVDVYLNFEKQGFKTEKKLGGEYGNSWTSTKKIEGIEYIVEIFSSNANNVESVSGTAIIDVTQKKIIATEQFFVFLSSVPYELADQAKARQWVKDNFNNDKATTIIGDAVFTIYSPSFASRMLTIEKIKE